MNKVEIKQKERAVDIENVNRTVKLEHVHIENDWYYASPIQPVRNPKERGE